MLTWKFADDSIRKFIETKILPRDADIVSVCWIFFYKENVILIRNKRWWEIPGWHREFGETVEQTLVREMKEEIWILPAQYTYQFYWYREIINKDSIFNETLGTIYPNPYYMLHYIGVVDRPTFFATWNDVFESSFFTLDEVKESSIRATELIIHAYEYKKMHLRVS